MPRLYVGLRLASLLVGAVESAWLSSLLGRTDSSWTALAGEALGLLIWGPYLFVSERARATFVRR